MTEPESGKKDRKEFIARVEVVQMTRPGQLDLAHDSGANAAQSTLMVQRIVLTDDGMKALSTTIKRQNLKS